MVISILSIIFLRVIVTTTSARVLLVLSMKFVCNLATYWFEHRYLSPFKIMIGFDIFAVIAIQFGKFGRHPLESLVVVFARGRRQSGFHSRVIVRGEQCLNGRHHIWRCLHGEGSRCSSRDCLRGAAELLPCVASPPGRARDDLVIPQQFCGKRRRPAKLVVSSIGGMVGVGGSSRWMMPGEVRRRE